MAARGHTHKTTAWGNSLAAGHMFPGCLVAHRRAWLFPKLSRVPRAAKSLINKFKTIVLFFFFFSPYTASGLTNQNTNDTRSGRARNPFSATAMYRCKQVLVRIG